MKCGSDLRPWTNLLSNLTLSITYKPNIESNKTCTATCVSRLGIYQTRECLQFLFSKTPLLQLLSLSLFLLLPPLPTATTSVVSTLKQMPEGLPPGGGRALQRPRETQQSRHHHKTKFVWGEEKKQCRKIYYLAYHKRRNAENKIMLFVQCHAQHK